MINRQDALEDYSEFISVVADFIGRRRLEIIWRRFYHQTDLYKKDRHLKVMNTIMVVDPKKERSEKSFKKGGDSDN